MKSNIDKLYDRKLENLQVPLPADSWKEMEALLDKKKKRRFFIFFWITLTSYGLSTGLLNNGGRLIQVKAQLHKNNQTLIQNLHAAGAENGIIVSSVSNNNHISISQLTNSNFHYISPKTNAEGVSNLITPNTSKLLVAESTTDNSISKPLLKKPATENENNLVKQKKDNINKLIPADSIAMPIRPKKKTKNTRWALQLAVSYSKITNNHKQAAPTNQTIHKQYDSIASNGQNLINSANIKLDIKFQINPSFSLSSGIRYRNISEAVDYHFERTQVPITDPNHKITGYSFVPANQAQKVLVNGYNQYQLIEFPMNLSYELSLNSKWSIESSLGASVACRTSQMGHAVNPTYLTLEQLNGINSSIGKVTYTWQSYFGAGYKFTSGTVVYAQFVYGRLYTTDNFNQPYSFTTLGGTTGFCLPIKTSSSIQKCK